MTTAQPAASILERLRDYYGEPVRRSSGDPISGLVGTILSQSTTDLNSERAFESLKESFNSWREVVDAPPTDVVDSIRPGGLAEQKAPTIQRALRAIEAINPDFSPDFLDQCSDDGVMEFLTSIKGVGQKTAACVLMFDLEREVLPVDTHVHRVSRRLGLVPSNADANKTQHRLEAQIGPEDRYAAHVLMIQHGRTICRSRSPGCSSCPIVDLCEYACQIHEDAD
jgi:endonuclease III